MPVAGIDLGEALHRGDHLPPRASEVREHAVGLICTMQAGRPFAKACLYVRFETLGDVHRRLSQGLGKLGVLRELCKHLGVGEQAGHHLTALFPGADLRLLACEHPRLALCEPGLDQLEAAGHSSELSMHRERHTGQPLVRGPRERDCPQRQQRCDGPTRLEPPNLFSPFNQRPTLRGPGGHDTEHEIAPLPVEVALLLEKSTALRDQPLVNVIRIHTKTSLSRQRYRYPGEEYSNYTEVGKALSPGSASPSAIPEPERVPGRFGLRWCSLSIDGLCRIQTQYLGKLVKQTNMSDERIVKTLLPISLIRRIDTAVLDGRGGFETRTELIKEACENLLLELIHEEAPAEPMGRHAELLTPPRSVSIAHRSSSARTGSSELPRDIADAVPQREVQELTPASLAGTALRLPAGRGLALQNGLVTPSAGPMIGLHNRDYPSLWALHRLARWAHTETVLFEDFLDRVTAAAWVFAAQLAQLGGETEGLRLTALFPRNLAKRQSAERGFKSFAIGTTPSRRAGVHDVPASGPVFIWRACDLVHEEDSFRIGLTPIGWDLLEGLGGVSLELPHSPALAERFLAHLADHAPDDRWGFDRVVAVIARQPDREKLVAEFATDHPEWSESVASSTTQGYVARAREWGLVEAKLMDNRYRLTEFGRRYVQQRS